MADRVAADDGSVTVVVRRSIALFAEEMERKLQRDDDRKGHNGWKTMDVHHLLNLMQGEVEELRAAMSEGTLAARRMEAVDVANFAMMIHDVSLSGSE